MKTKLIFLALLVSMCSSPAQESEDIKIISIVLSENAFDGFFKLIHLSFFE